MPLQNRVTPFGAIEANPARGDLMGNRGILHGKTKELGHRRWTHNNWIVCQTEFNSRHREIMKPQRYTELFFLDEAVAITAGHRPCCEYQRHDCASLDALSIRASIMLLRARIYNRLIIICRVAHYILCPHIIAVI